MFLLIFMAVIIGFVLSIILKITSIILIALIVVGLYVIILWYYKYKMDNEPTPNTPPGNTSNNTSTTKSSNKSSNSFNNKSNNLNTTINIINTSNTTNTIPTATITANGALIGDLVKNDLPININKNNNNSKNKNNNNSKNGLPLSIQNNTEYSMDKPPFDGLPPGELLTRLDYLYYATANPNKMVNYHDFKTHADKYLDEDGSKLSVNDTKLQAYAAGFYPQLTANQIDARDCLNYGSGPGSCFQSKQLFYNVKNDFNILDKGINNDNANLVVREDFSMPMNLDINERDMPVLFMNAPRGNQDFPLDITSNENVVKYMADESLSLCRNCKLAVCKDDYCSLQNQLFM